MPKPILNISGLTIRAENITILNNIEWTIQKGEHWALIGPNGCGKTSLLAALTAYLSPNEGRVEILGERYGETDWQDVRKQIGIVSTALARRVPADEPALTTVNSGLTAQLGFWTRDKTPEPKRALRKLSTMGIRSLADRAWGVLSQGERQKVFIARALMADPKLLILDEPCAGLDPVARENFLISIQKLIQRKRCPHLILVTHHIEEILPEITHVLVMKKGKVLAAGPKSKILSSPIMSQAFGANIRVRRNARTQRYSFAVIKDLRC